MRLKEIFSKKDRDIVKATSLRQDVSARIETPQDGSAASLAAAIVSLNLAGPDLGSSDLDRHPQLDVPATALPIEY